MPKSFNRNKIGKKFLTIFLNISYLIHKFSNRQNSVGSIMKGGFAQDQEAAFGA
jgi:hypothetical protein